MVNPTQGKAGEDVGGDQQGGHAVFRFQAGVGGNAGDAALHHVLRRRANADAAHRTFAVEHHAAGCRDEREIQVARPVQAAFLGAREHHLHLAAQTAVFHGGGDTLHDDGQAGLAVAAQDGGSVGAQGVAVGVEGGLDAPARFHGVHVGGQHHRGFAGAAVAAGQGGHQVAVSIVLYRRSEVAEPRGEVGVDGVLLSGGAVDTDEFGYGSDESFAVRSWL